MTASDTFKIILEELETLKEQNEYLNSTQDPFMKIFTEPEGMLIIVIGIILFFGFKLWKNE